MQRLSRKEWLALLIGLSAMSLLPMLALAHQAPTGWSYSAYCCGGKDCQPIAAENVEFREGGYLVTLPPGSHAMVQGETLHRLFSPDEVKMSGDGNWHACVVVHRIRCLYAPLLGS